MPKLKPKARMPKAGARHYHVVVTQADIDRAIKSDSAKCVVAQAIARTIPDAHHIGVDAQVAKFTRADGRRYRFIVPPPVERYAIDFDYGAKIEPFHFRLIESNMLPMLRRPRTPAGKTIDRARVRARRLAMRTARKRGADPMRAGRLAARRAYKLARHSATGPITQSNGDRRSYAPTRIRQYGHRAMRINQARAAGDLTLGPPPGLGSPSPRVRR